MNNTVKVLRGDYSSSGRASRTLNKKKKHKAHAQGALRMLYSSESPKRKTCDCYATSFKISADQPHTLCSTTFRRDLLATPLLPNIKMARCCRRPPRRPPRRHLTRGCIASYLPFVACWERNRVHLHSSYLVFLH